MIVNNHVNLGGRGYTRKTFTDSLGKGKFGEPLIKGWYLVGSGPNHWGYRKLGYWLEHPGEYGPIRWVSK